MEAISLNVGPLGVCWLNFVINVSNFASKAETRSNSKIPPYLLPMDILEGA